jgi:fatty-acyl-CoA synthase
LASPSAANQDQTSPSKAWLRALELTARLDRAPTRTLPIVIEELAVRFTDKAALLSEHETLNFRDLAERMNKVARWALASGLAGHTICLLMTNQPDYLAIWLGLTRVGCVVALLNTNLRGAALAHCIKVAESHAIIVGRELRHILGEALASTHIEAVVWNHSPSDPLFGQDSDAFSSSPLSADEAPLPRLEDRALCIYTSGTTGLPKAANVSHFRIMTWSYWFAGILNIGSDDRMLNCLPMYHSVGGITAIGSVLVNGGSVALLEKFSASRFWDDVVRWDCTLFQYIGELCRYLLNAPESPNEREHRLRIACGNGLRADVWQKFQDRFGIPQIVEFYAATEGTFSLINVEGQPGSIGRIPPFLAHRFPSALVKYDAESGAPARDENGRCSRCARGEIGEAIGKIASPSSDGARFEGYTSKKDSDAKILRNVFADGDCWFRTGDLMRQDEKGFFYFVDRVGDTFRWKGENVSTFEVEEVLAASPGVEEAIVYGVAVPGADGRAGMAALTTNADFNLSQLHDHLCGKLPSYARPLFLRIVPRIERTETFKPKKAQIARESFDPAKISDVLYFHDGEKYCPLDAALFAQIRRGEVRI